MLKTAGVILFLGWNSWKDIRKKEISLIITGIFAFLGIMTAFYNRNVTAQFLFRLLWEEVLWESVQCQEIRSEQEMAFC